MIESGTSKICLYSVRAGFSIKYGVNNECDETWFVIAGSGKMIINSDIITLEKKSVLDVPKGITHGLTAITDLYIIVVKRK